MKMNWKTLKVLLALVIIIVTIFWTVNTIRPRSYSGTDLNFSIGGGSVSIVNDSDELVDAQVVSTGSRSFRVLSSVDSLSGNSTRLGNGSNTTHVFDLSIPAGTNEFSVKNGKDLRFIATSTEQLKATVNPMNSSTQNTILLIGLVIILGAIYYASNATKHRWINTLLGKETLDDTQGEFIAPDVGQGKAAKSYGDNRG